MILNAIKINLLALLGIPLLCLSTIIELFARAFEKFPLILRMAFVTITVIAVTGSLHNSEIEPGIELASALGICALIITVAFWVISIFSSLIDLLIHVILRIFDFFCGLSYRWFLSIDEICEAEYQIISLRLFFPLNLLACMGYSLLRFVDWMIVHLLGLSYILSMFLTFGISYFILECYSLQLKTTQGITLLTYLQTGDSLTVIYTCLQIISFLIPIATILLSLGKEWNNWAIELKMDSLEYDEYIDAIQDYDFYLEEDDLPDEEALEMQDILNDHTATIEDLRLEIEDTLALKNDAMLRKQWNEYLNDLYQIVDEIEQTYHNEIPHKEFKRMIPRIRRLDYQREGIFREIDALLELTKNPVNVSTYFIGCTTRDKLDKRYKELCKAYHPDSATGNQELFIDMKAEYQELKTYLSS